MHGYRKAMLKLVKFLFFVFHGNPVIIYNQPFRFARHNFYNTLIAVKDILIVIVLGLHDTVVFTEAMRSEPDFILFINQSIYRVLQIGIDLIHGNKCLDPHRG